MLEKIIRWLTKGDFEDLMGLSSTFVVLVSILIMVMAKHGSWLVVPLVVITAMTLSVLFGAFYCLGAKTKTK